MRALCFRREHPDLFKAGSDYIPLFADEPAREHVIAFARQREGQTAITLTPRFAYTLMKGEMRAPLGSEAWEGSTVLVPSNGSTRFHNVMTGEIVQANEGRLLCGEVFRSFPVALLTSV